MTEVLESNVLSRSDLSALAAANAFQCFSLRRKDAIWEAETAPYKAPEKIEGYPEPFLPETKVAEASVAFPGENEIETIESDYRATGVSLGRHLARVIREQAWVYQIPVEQIVTSNLVQKAIPDRFIPVFGMVQVRQSPGTARKMLFVTLEDEYGTIPLVIRPHIYKRYGHLIEGQSFLCVYGKLQMDGRAYSLLVSQVFAPILKKADIIPVERRKRYQEINSGDFRKIRNYM